MSPSDLHIRGLTSYYFHLNFTSFTTKKKRKIEWLHVAIASEKIELGCNDETTE